MSLEEPDLLRPVSEGACLIVISVPVGEKFPSSRVVSRYSWKMERHPKSYLHFGKAESYPLFKNTISFAT